MIIGSCGIIKSIVSGWVFQIQSTYDMTNKNLLRCGGGLSFFVPHFLRLVEGYFYPELIQEKRKETVCEEF